MEYTLFYKLIRKKLKKKLEDYNHRRFVTTAQKMHNLKKWMKELLLNYPTVKALKSKDVCWIMNRTNMKEICRKSFTSLFTCRCFINSNLCRLAASSPCTDHQAFHMKNVKAADNTASTSNSSKLVRQELRKVLNTRYMPRKAYLAAERSRKPIYRQEG